jgi:hypothetical protein
MNPVRWLCCTALLLPAGAAWAQDRADIDRTQIIGNRELPKVLTIVPWKKPLPGTLAGRPVHSVLDEALAPVDREVFRRQVDYGSATASPRRPCARRARTGCTGSTGRSAHPFALNPTPLHR